MKQLRRVDLLSRVVFSQPQRYMTAAAKHNVISLNDDDTYSGSEGGDFDWMPLTTDAQANTILTNAFKEDGTELDKRFTDQFGG